MRIRELVEVFKKPNHFFTFKLSVSSIAQKVKILIYYKMYLKFGSDLYFWNAVINKNTV